MKHLFLYEVHTVKDGDAFLAASDLFNLIDKIQEWLDLDKMEGLSRVTYIKQLGKVGV